MLELGSLAFATPWILAVLATLPVLYWLLRVTPPAPRRLPFPAIRILASLDQSEETPARTPWWLLALRILAAALLILGLARPVLNPDSALHGSGPVFIVVDNSWASAKHWPLRQQTLNRLIDRADRQGRQVALLATAPDSSVSADGSSVAATAPLPPEQARRRAQAIRPQPWPSDRAAALEAVATTDFGGSVSVFWLADGLADPLTDRFAETLQGFGSLEVVAEPAPALAKLMAQGRSEGSELAATLSRAQAGSVETVTVRVIAEDGRLLTREPVAFEAGQTRTDLRVTLPLELRNQVARLEIESEETAGSVLLADEQWRRRPVGIITTPALDNLQPLLNETYYLERALSPFAEIQRGEFTDLADASLAVVLLPDSAGLTDAESDRLTRWVDDGGMLVRFGGPRMAQDPEGMLPVRLRTGTRELGGALSWDKPAQLAPFDAESPFAGLNVPGDVEVRRQVLAEPELDLAAKTWARLADGTPLVTADRRGDGQVVLVHTTADTSWSDLALSGLFVEMLQRVVQRSRGISGDEVTVALPPYRTLDATGRLGDPAPDAVAIEPGTLGATVVSPRHPPGLYGSADTRTAVNLSEHLGDTYGPLPDRRSTPALQPIAELPDGVGRMAYGGSGGTDLKHWLILAAVLLVLADMIISLVLRGLVPRFSRPAPAPLSALVVGLATAFGTLLLVSDPAAAQVRERIEGNDGWIIDATVETRLAYVITGDANLDSVSKAGLAGLSEILRRRTAVETGAPMGVDPEVDELFFFPLLYWPVTENQRALSQTAIDRINEYLRTGGTILFDTRDAGVTAPGYVTGSGLASGPGGRRLREMARQIQVPPLQTVPPEHVLTKAFYLLQEFPGRYADNGLWVELPDGRVNDGVASVIVGGNDWASAWAIDENGRPMFPIAGGGERQREMAYRFGVNLTMYALTGNYKADQVHVPAILERLGQ